MKLIPISLVLIAFSTAVTFAANSSPTEGEESYGKLEQALEEPHAYHKTPSSMLPSRTRKKVASTLIVVGIWSFAMFNPSVIDNNLVPFFLEEPLSEWEQFVEEHPHGSKPIGKYQNFYEKNFAEYAEWTDRRLTAYREPYERNNQTGIFHLKEEMKILYLSAAPNSDHNRALNPARGMPLCLIGKVSDLTYKTIDNHLQICEKIGESAQNGLIDKLFIGAHGSSNALYFGRRGSSPLEVLDQFPSNCFDGLRPKAKIVLVACETGGNELFQPNIAEWISAVSGREVIAPQRSINAAFGECFIDRKSGNLEFFLDKFVKQISFNTYGSSEEAEVFWEKRFALFFGKYIIPIFLIAVGSLGLVS